MWIHSKCNKLNKKDYDRLTKEHDDIPFICLCCISDNLPFSTLSDRNFDIAVTKGINYLLDNDNDLQFLNNHQLEITKKFQAILNNKPYENDDDDALQPPVCSYYSIDEFSKAKFNPTKSFSILHFNIHSIQRHVEELRTLLLMLNFNFDFIAITESKLYKGKEPSSNILLEGYNEPFHCNTEATKGGVLLYASNKFNIIPRPDLQTYSPKEVESVFIEVVNHNSKNDIVGVIYRHHSIDKSLFIDDHISPLLSKLKLENKKTSLLQVTLI